MRELGDRVSLQRLCSLHVILLRRCFKIAAIFAVVLFSATAIGSWNPTCLVRSAGHYSCMNVKLAQVLNFWCMRLICSCRLISLPCGVCPGGGTVGVNPGGAACSSIFCLFLLSSSSCCSSTRAADSATGSLTSPPVLARRRFRLAATSVPPRLVDAKRLSALARCSFQRGSSSSMRMCWSSSERRTCSPQFGQIAVWAARWRCCARGT
jgi:hypothetical protein